MRFTRHHLAAFALVALTACGQDHVTTPDREPVTRGSVGGTTGAVFSEPGDTTNRQVVGPAVIHGDVILMTVREGSGGGVDTSQTAPLAGARLSLSQRSIEGNPTVIATAVAGADGTFAFAAVPAGSYVLLAEGPVGSSVYPATAYIATTSTDVSVNFRLVNRP